MGVKHKHSKEIISRLSKVEGHVRAIKKMIEDEKSCDEVLLQFSAVEAALKKTSKLLLSDHFENCIINMVTDEKLKEELEEFQRVFNKYFK